MIRKGLAVAVILLFIGMSVVPSTAVTELKDASPVSFDGNTLYVGGSGPNNYTTIQSAVNDAVDGDTVYVYDDSSPYYENIVVNKSINLFGEDRNTTVIHGVRGTTVVEIIADGVNVTGFTIEGEGSNTGILIRRYSNSTISNNNISNCTFGIELFWSENIIVSENLFDSCVVSITSDGSGMVISGNTLNSSKTLDFIGDITFWGGGNNIIVNNTLTNFKGGHRKGMRLEGVHHSVIKGNTFNGYNNMAIELYRTFNNVISGNAFLNNGWGIFVGTSMFNTICCNNFIGNNRSAGFGFFSPFNTWDSNYWGRPRILPKPIFGIMGIIPWVNFDWNPASEPYDIEV